MPRRGTHLDAPRIALVLVLMVLSSGRNSSRAQAPGDLVPGHRAARPAPTAGAGSTAAPSRRLQVISRPHRFSLLRSSEPLQVVCSSSAVPAAGSLVCFPVSSACCEEGLLGCRRSDGMSPAAAERMLPSRRARAPAREEQQQPWERAGPSQHDRGGRRCSESMWKLHGMRKGCTSPPPVPFAAALFREVRRAPSVRALRVRRERV